MHELWKIEITKSATIAIKILKYQTNIQNTIYKKNIYINLTHENQTLLLGVDEDETIQKQIEYPKTN